MTEAEWEYVARAGTSAVFYGVDKAQVCRFANVMDATMRQFYLQKSGSFFGDINGQPYLSARCEDKHVFTAPVGSFAANAFGVHDMLGNVKEHVVDCWHETLASLPTNGAPRKSGCARDGNVVRGGGWSNIAERARPSSREAIGKPYLTARFSDIGFRVARDGER